MRNKSVSIHSQTMVPRADIPRASFLMEHALKTTFDASYVIPIYLEEMLPGDTFNLRMNGVCRLATPLVPVMDNLWLDVFFMVCPWRLLWDNVEKFFGAQDNPDDSTDYVIPQLTVPTDGWDSLSLADYFGLPVGNVNDPTPIDATVNRMPFDMYNLCMNEWFRDENLMDSLVVNTGDATTTFANQYGLFRRRKRKDYFTGALPFPQKGDPVEIPIVGGTFPVQASDPLGGTAPVFRRSLSIGTAGQFLNFAPNNDNIVQFGGPETTSGTNQVVWGDEDDIGLEVDVSSGVVATINLLRQSFQIQKLLERDARGGTRYTEMVQAHFGVRPPDFRLQRPEYIGGSSSRVHINPVAQTSASSIEGTDTPQGTLAAVGTGVIQSGFQYSATEHSYVMGFMCARVDVTYQQGQARLWNRRTRFDVYHPVFAALGEQAVYRKEIYWTGVPGEAADDYVFGYQEAWAEYRYHPSQITGLFRSVISGSYPSLDIWHYSQEFETPPLLNEEFIIDAGESVVARSTAVGSSAGGQQLIIDCLFSNRAARPMPLYSVPGLIDHF